MQTKNLLLLTALTTGATFVSLAPSAQAAILWSWTFADPGVGSFNPGAGSGTLTTVDTADGNGNFLVTAITGTFDGITGGLNNVSLLPVGTVGNDNLINSSGEIVSAKLLSL